MAAIVATGLSHRLACARGGLWLDEAVSAIQAQDTATPLGVFLKINHDNNHHINSLWLQLVSPAAPPMLARALSIATSTVAILMAGLLSSRRAPLLGLVTAAFFAFSPMLVTLGSEARGYSPLLLAFLSAVMLVDRWVDSRYRTRPAVALALCFFLGAFCHLMMFFVFFALAGWVLIAVWRQDGLVCGIRQSFRLLLPSAVALALVVLVIWGAAATSPAGFKFGGWQPFSWGMYLRGVSEMAGYTFGVPALGSTWLLLLPVFVALATIVRVSRLPFHWLAILAFPLAIACLHPANVGFARYYLLTTLALLILAAELVWLGLSAGAWRRWLAVCALAAFGVGSMTCNIALMRNLRADPLAAVRALAARAPAGGQIAVPRDTGLPQLVVAAAAEHYPLQIQPKKRKCPPARFLFVDRFEWEPFPAEQQRCGRRYREISAAHATGLSGTDWTLYELEP